ncbi:helix-turn-helix transcriptional regulator [Aurantimicrobium minutum]|uniref:helix-turn-helix transcriptional regulator n=1 Tax=Aurantimicrobium minutum TaxID=708131 RepID=UPI00248EBD98|nr:hypothetical protein [Aurantimicrobium minutum]
MQENYLTPAQVCDRIPGMTLSSLASMRYLGTGPRYFKPSHKRVLYSETDIVEWLEGTARYGTHPDKVAS